MWNHHLYEVTGLHGNAQGPPVGQNLSHSLWPERSLLSTWLHKICLYNSLHPIICGHPAIHPEPFILGSTLGLTCPFPKDIRKSLPYLKAISNVLCPFSYFWIWNLCSSITNPRSNGLNLITFSGIILPGDEFQVLPFCLRCQVVTSDLEVAPGLRISKPWLVIIQVERNIDTVQRRNPLTQP